MVIQKKFTRILTLISDIITIPVLLLSLITAFTMYNAKKNGYVPSLFGSSVVTVVSGSMRASGFEIGDTVMVRKVDPGTLVVGDIIAFYAYVDPNNKPAPDNFIETTDEEGTGLSLNIINGGAASSLNKAAEAGSQVWFHQIIGIGMDSRGLWFRTKGTSNARPDSKWIYQDFIVGKFQEGSDSPLIREAMSFMSSRLGIIVFAIIPSGISLILDTLTLIELIDLYMLEKKKKLAVVRAVPDEVLEDD